MDLQKLILISALLLGFLFSYLFNVTLDLSKAGLPLRSSDYLSAVMLPIAIFILSILFFGYGSIIVVFLSGFSYGYLLNNTLTTKILIITFSRMGLVIPIAAIAGAILGKSTLDAIRNKTDIKPSVKTTTILLIISIILSILIQYISTTL